MNWKPLILPSVLSIAIVAGCNTGTDTQSEQGQVADELRPQKQQEQTDEETEHKLGYVRYQQDQVNNDQEKQQSARIDRPKMADMITRMILQNDQFAEAATLVTDEEVLIAYELKDDADKETSADIANKTATSAMPGFFDIYVSDNSHLMNDIRSLHNSDTNKNYDNTLDRIIKEMKESSQGNQNKTR